MIANNNPKEHVFRYLGEPLGHLGRLDVAKGSEGEGKEEKANERKFKFRKGWIRTISRCEGGVSMC